MRRPSSLSLLVALAACTSTPEGEPPTPGLAEGDLRGRAVVLESTGVATPAAGAHVSLAGTRLGVSTGADGKFALTGLPAGRFDLRLEWNRDGAGGAEAAVRAPAELAPSKDLGDVVLAAFGAIDVTVKRGTTPVAGARVVVATVASVVTNAEGVAHLPDLAPGSYEVSALVEGATEGLVAMQIVVVTGGATSALQLDAATTVSRGTLGVRVVGPQAGTVVELVGATSSTNLPAIATGLATNYAADVPAGIYRVVARREGGRPVEITNVFPGATIADVVITPVACTAARDGACALLDPVDTDGDGLPNGVDLCPTEMDPTQPDVNGDGLGDACHCEAAACATGQCGTIPDGCGGTLACGGCPGGGVCGAAGTPEANTCTCDEKTCTDLDATCGTPDDGCGTPLSCGTCDAATVCGTEGAEAFKCVCPKVTCAAANAQCGEIDDGCGGITNCGVCGPDLGCAALGTPNVCEECFASTCADLGYDCGIADDGCGHPIDCGPVDCGASGLTCGANGTANVCGCQALTCDDVGGACGDHVDDGCGGDMECWCNAPNDCGGGGTPGFCGCTPTTCENEGATCGQLGDGCGGTLDCGGCNPGATCGGAGIPFVCGSPICTPGGWCWANPALFATHLYGGAILPDGALLGAGGAGTIVTWDGKTITGKSGLIDGTFRAAWGAGPGETWVAGGDPAGNAILAKWDGTTLTPASPGGAPLRGLAGTSTTDGWAVGDGGRILRRTSGSWTAMPSGTTSDLMSVFAPAAGAAYAVGSSGTALSWNGTGWDPMALPADYAAATLNDIWGLTPNDLWISADRGLTARRTTGAWADVPFPDPGFSLGTRTVRRIRGAAADDLYAFTSNGDGSRWDGATWTRGSGEQSYFDDEGLYAIRMEPNQHGRAFGAYGHFSHLNAGYWHNKQPRGTDHFSHIVTIWAGGPGEAMAFSGSGGYCTSWNGQGWDDSGTRCPAIASTAASGLSRSDLWVAGWPGYGSEGDLQHFDGSTWTPATLPVGTSRLTALYIADATHGWAASSAGSLLTWDGTTWTAGSTPYAGPRALWGSGPGDVWLVASDQGGTTGQLWHFNGNAWTDKTPPMTAAGRFTAVHGRGPNDVWVVGSAPTGPIAWHWTGAWTEQVMPAGNEDLDLISLVAVGPNDVWAGGARRFAHWDGVEWKVTLSGASERIAAMAANPDGVFAGGPFQAILVKKP